MTILKDHFNRRTNNYHSSLLLIFKGVGQAPYPSLVREVFRGIKGCPEGVYGRFPGFSGPVVCLTDILSKAILSTEKSFNLTEHR